MTDLIAYAPRILAAAVIGLGLMILAIQGAPTKKQGEGAKPSSPDSGQKTAPIYETPTIGE